MERKSVLIAGNSRTEQVVRQMRPDAKIVGVLKDLALVEYVSSETLVHEIMVDGQMVPRGETLEQWVSRFSTAFSQVKVSIVTDDARGTNAPVPAAKVITSQTTVVWSPKGGVGKTFVSTNLACAAAMATQGKAVLLDLDVYSGDVATYLDLADEPTMVEILPQLIKLRPEGLERYAQKHASTHLNVICSPRRPEFSNLVGVEHVRHLLSLAARRWGLLYVDTAPDITSDIVGEAIHAASAIVLVITQDVCALRQAKVALDIFRKLGIPEDCIYLVLNRLSKDAPIPEGKVEEFLEKTLAASVPDDRRTVEKSVFQGKPVVMYSKTEIAGAIWGLLSEISPGLPSPQAEKKPRKVRRLRFW